MVVRRGSSRGQSVVEFALILPIMLLVVIGIADFGRAFFTLVNISNAAREGARWGIIRQCSDTSGASTNSIQYRVIQAATAVSIDASSGVAITYPDGSAAVGNRIQVTVSTPYEPLTPIIGDLSIRLAGGSITLSQSAQMLIENINSSCAS